MVIVDRDRPKAFFKIMKARPREGNVFILKMVAALGRTSRNIKAGPRDQHLAPFLHDTFDGQDGLKKWKNPEGKLHGVPSQGFLGKGVHLLGYPEPEKLDVTLSSLSLALRLRDHRLSLQCFS